MKKILIACFALVVVGCGGGADNKPAVDGGATGPVNDNQAPANNTPDDPKPDPDAWKHLEGTTPDGWETLEQSVLLEAFGKRGRPSLPYRAMFGITSEKAPGPTSGDDKWNAWLGVAGVASLFHIKEESNYDEATLTKHAKALYPDFNPTQTGTSPLGISATDSDNAASAHLIKRKGGVYIVMCISKNPGEFDAQTKSFNQWIKSLKEK